MQRVKHLIGFTLIESLIVLALMAGFAAYAVPSLRLFLARNGVAHNAQNLTEAIRFTRAQAMQRGVNVVLCRSLQAEDSDAPVCASDAADWSSGWLIFADRNGNGLFELGKGDRLLQVQGSIAHHSQVVQQGAYVALQFLPSGVAKTGASTFNLTPAGANPDNYSRSICVSLVGRVRAMDAKGKSGCDAKAAG